jgi:hypothetical protein
MTDLILPGSPTIDRWRTHPVREWPVAATRAALAERSGGRCEAVGCNQEANQLAHRKRRSQGGPMSPVNALHLCPFCHAWSGNNPDAAKARGWEVRQDEDPRRMPALIQTPHAPHPGWFLLLDDPTAPMVKDRSRNPWMAQHLTMRVWPEDYQPGQRPELPEWAA